MNENITNIAHIKLSFRLKYALCKWKEHIENAICEKYIYVFMYIYENNYIDNNKSKTKTMPPLLHTAQPTDMA